VTLSVHTHPVFTELLGDVALNKGERLVLACGVSGIPLPRIKWSFNNNIIPGFFNHEMLAFRGNILMQLLCFSSSFPLSNVFFFLLFIHLRLML